VVGEPVTHEPCKQADGDPAHAKRPTTRSGPRSPWLCATCRRAKTAATKLNRRAAHVERTYGLSAEDVELIRSTMPVNVDGKRVCPGCLRATGERKALATDHDHALERAGHPIRETVRGFLCGPCNQVIGRFSPAALRRLANYVEDPPAPKVLDTNHLHRRDL
jgi:Recombination endonuclease VII